MNGKIALRDIIKAIVILKPGVTIAVIQRMIWTKTPSATIWTAPRFPISITLLSPTLTSNI
jgi:hypothetical protein